MLQCSSPLAAYSKRFTPDEIMNDMMIAYPNTRPMCSANCDGAAAAVVVSDAKLKTLSLEQQRRAREQVALQHRVAVREMEWQHTQPAIGDGEPEILDDGRGVRGEIGVT